MHETRESWLNAATALLTERFKSEGLTPLGSVRVGVGFTGMGKKSNRIGETWASEASADSTREIIISTVLDTPRDVLGTLAHELIHASLPPDAKHGPEFKRIALAIGLEGKMTATTIGPMLADILDWMAEDLGTYPHARLTVSLGGPKKQTVRMLKVACEPCEYVVRMSRTTLDLGAPLCGVCQEPMHEA